MVELRLVDFVLGIGVRLSGEQTAENCVVTVRAGDAEGGGDVDVGVVSVVGRLKNL